MKKPLRSKPEPTTTGPGGGYHSRWLERVDLASIIDGLPHGVLLVDSAGRVIDMNRTLEALTGYGRRDARGVRGEFLLRANFNGAADPIGTVLLRNEPLTLEGDIINRNRKKVPIRMVAAPLRDLGGQTPGVICTVEDISLLKDLDHKAQGFSGRERIIGHSSKIAEILELLPIAARTESSALITGETGTGKDLIAEAIHQASPRARQPFIKVNCGALPESLLESELFGHVRGAFTGADRDRPGMFRLAQGGTIFLTEIGDLPLPLQVKLLTVLDDREFFPVGGSKKVKVDVRIIAATHRDLGEYVRRGRFREDLYYRLNVLRLHLPPLRERGDDIRLFLDHFRRHFNATLKKKIRGFTAASLALLSAYHYPGNVRELRNIVEAAANICPGELIDRAHLPEILLTAPSPAAEPEAIRRAAGPPLPEPESWKREEKRLIMQALIDTGGHRARTAQQLGWSRSKLWRKIKQHRLD